ncbi:MAG: histidine phosphatase family protein [Patescibacteria group bacterium]|nr:histidine phosphatase family protein [Patescibacteria group bacterium]
MKKELFEKIKKAALFSLKKPGGQKKKLPQKESNSYSTLYVFRHSQSCDNYRRIFSGRRQSRLTPEGIKQAKELAEKLKNKKINLFIISPLVRCQQTIKPIQKYHPRAKVRVEKLLKERDYGKLTGKSKMKLMREDFKKAILYRRSYDVPPPGGESIKQVQKRVFPFCKKLEKKLSKEKINLAICCTNNTMRLLRMYFEKLSVEEMLTLENPFDDYAAYIVK